MKRLIIITGIVIYSLFAAAMLINTEIQRKPYERTAVETYPLETVTESVSGDIYILKSIDGKIAVKETSTGKIIKKTDTLVSILPEKDREMLKKGIKVKSDEELRLLLEDFCS